MADKIVKQDVEDMLSAFLETPGEPPAAPPAEPPPVEPPAEPPVEPPAEPPVEPKPSEPPIEPKPGEEPPVKPPVEPPVEPPAEPPDPRLAKPPVEPPTEPPVEPTEVEILQRQNQLLLERIEKISGGEPAPAPAPEPTPAEPKPGEPVPEPTPEPAPAPVPPAEIKIDEINFLEGKSQEEIERIVENPAELNKVLNQVYLKAIERSIPLAQERSLLAIPQVVVAHIQRYNKLKGLVDDFYKVNEDLKIAQKSVGIFANEVHSEHTDWTTKQVFDEAAVRTRKALGMPEPPPKPPGEPGKPAVPGPGEPPPDPAFAGPRGSRQRGPAGAKLTGIAKEIDDLMPDRG